MTTQPQNWENIKALFHEALELDSSARSAFLRDKCPDAKVRAEVERLLAEHDHAGAFLSTAAFDDSLLGADVPPKEHPDIASSPLGITSEIISPGETTGTVIGRYHLLQRIGEGGMGEVWLAE